MNLEVIIDSNAGEEKLIYHTADANDPFIATLQNVLRTKSKNPSRIFMRKNEQIIPISLDELVCIYTDGRNVVAETKDNKAYLDYRLNEIEDILDEAKFFRVNHSEIVNINAIAKLDLSIDGTVKVILKNSHTTFVSRRKYKDFKIWIGLK